MVYSAMVTGTLENETCRSVRWECDKPVANSFHESYSISVLEMIGRRIIKMHPVDYYLSVCLCSIFSLIGCEVSGSDHRQLFSSVERNPYALLN